MAQSNKNIKRMFTHLKGLDFMEADNFQLQNEGTYKGLQAYKNSKLCNVLFTYQLADKLKQERVLVNAVDPGWYYVNINSCNKCMF